MKTLLLAGTTENSWVWSVETILWFRGGKVKSMYINPLSFIHEGHCGFTFIMIFIVDSVADEFSAAILSAVLK